MRRRPVTSHSRRSFTAEPELQVVPLEGLEDQTVCVFADSLWEAVSADFDAAGCGWGGGAALGAASARGSGALRGSSLTERGVQSLGVGALPDEEVWLESLEDSLPADSPPPGAID